MPAAYRQTRWFRLTPDRFVIGLLAVEGLLWLSDRFGWLGWHKGYAVLTGVAAVGVAVLVMLGWFGVALVFRRRFQFSLRTLLVLVVAVALPCSWLAVEMRAAKREHEAEAEIEKLGGEVQVSSFEPTWLQGMLGVDLFVPIIQVRFARVNDSQLDSLKALDTPIVLDLQASGITDSQLDRISGMSKIQCLLLDSNRITDSGIRNFKGLNELRALTLTGTQMSDAGLENLRELRQLKLLVLPVNKVTEEGAKKLRDVLQDCDIRLEQSFVLDVPDIPPHDAK